MKLWQKLSVSLALLGGALAAAPMAHAQTVTNGGFETGDFTGWGGTATDSSNDYGFVDGPFTPPTPSNAHSGSYEAQLYSGDAPDFGTLTQTLATTPGTTYAFDFWLAFADNSSDVPLVPTTPVTPEFTVSVDGTQELDLTNIPAITGPIASNYTDYSFNYTATGASAPLKFQYTSGANGTFYLDDIRAQGQGVTLTPETPSGLLLLTALVPAALLGLRQNRRRRQN